MIALGRPRQNIRASLGIVTGISGSADAETPDQADEGAVLAGQMKGDKKQWKGRKWRKRLARDGGGWALALAGGVIHSDVTMYPGFSGGPLLAADGKVYGMNTSGFPGGLSTAIPLASIRESVAALLSKGKIQTGYLGIGVQTAQLPDAVAESLESGSWLAHRLDRGGQPRGEGGSAGRRYSDGAGRRSQSSTSTSCKCCSRGWKWAPKSARSSCAAARFGTAASSLGRSMKREGLQSPHPKPVPPPK